MKFFHTHHPLFTTLVAPLVGAWIEIRTTLMCILATLVAPLVGAWIEIDDIEARIAELKVAPLVGAWIEIILPAKVN